LTRSGGGYKLGVSRSDDHQERSLTRLEKRVLALLGLPTFGLALSITAVTTYVPLLAQQFTSSTTVIGVIIAAEGLVALVVPIAAGAWSDQLRTPIGGRLPFLIVGAPLIGASLALMGFMTSLPFLALLVLVFFIAYYAAYEPYRALYPDLLEAQVAGRGQSSQAVFRGTGTGVALIGGGLLFSLSPKLPFLAFAVLAVGAMAEFSWGLLGSRGARNREQHDARTARQTIRRMLELLRNRPALRAFLVANALWELSLAALKTFIVLFLTVGVGLKMTGAVGVIAIVAVMILIAAPISGKLGDRFGKTRVVSAALWVYGIGLLVPLFTQKAWIVAPVMPVVAFGGGMILTLPYAILMPLMPEEEHGLLTGFYSFTRGLGILAGPLLAGAAISGLRDQLSSTQGYAAMWLVCGAAILATIPLMGPLRAKEARNRRERARRESGGHSAPEPASA
jgi:MFS family permease